jgi:hypothetical protein
VLRISLVTFSNLVYDIEGILFQEDRSLAVTIWFKISSFKLQLALGYSGIVIPGYLQLIIQICIFQTWHHTRPYSAAWCSWPSS